MSSEKQVAASRANGKKGRGPTTEAGRRKSKMNARKHGLRASRHAALADSGYAQAERRRKWLAQADAQTDFDEFIISGCASLSFKFDRAQRVAAADVATEIDDADGKDADQADELGDLLFFDPTGPTPVHGIERRPLQKIRPSWSGEAIDPNKPARIVKRLEKTVAGCEFLLREWKRLRALAQTGFWLPPDRFRAIRMLGRQPVEAMEHRGVAMIYVASHGVMRLGETDFDDLHGDLTKVAQDRLVVRVKARFKDLFVASTQAECRKLLVDLADQHIKRLNSKAARLLKKAEAKAEQTVDEMGNDRSPRGERMLALEMRCLNTIKRLMAPYKKEAKEKPKRGAKLAAGCPDEGRKVRAEWRGERGETGGDGGRLGGEGEETYGHGNGGDPSGARDPRRTGGGGPVGEGEETCGPGDGGDPSGARDPRRTRGVRAGEWERVESELDESDIRACGGFLPVGRTGLASGTLEMENGTGLGGGTLGQAEARTGLASANFVHGSDDAARDLERVCEVVGGPSPRPSPGGRGSSLVPPVVAVVAPAACSERVCEFVGGPSPRPSPGGRGSSLVPPVVAVVAPAAVDAECAGTLLVESAVDAGFGGISPATGETASCESVTNEPELCEDVICSKPQKIVEVTADSGDDSGLDRTRLEPGVRGQLSVVRCRELLPATGDGVASLGAGETTQSAGGNVTMRSIGTRTGANPRSGGEEFVSADPSADCGGAAATGGESDFAGGRSNAGSADCGEAFRVSRPPSAAGGTSSASEEDEDEAELRELQAQLAIETVKRQARAGPMAEAIRDLMASSPEAMELLKEFLPRAP